MEDSDFTPEKIRQAQLLAGTEAGKQLKALLQQSNAQGLKRAMDQAAQGNLTEAKKAIADFLTTPEAAALLAQLRQSP